MTDASAQVPTASATDELDPQVLAQACGGDPAAFVEFVRCYEARVFGLLGRLLCGQTDRCEDLAQETFLRAFRALPTFSSDGSARVSTWLLTIATRIAIDELRRRRRRPTLVSRDDAESESLATRRIPEPEQRLLRAAIEAALDRLDPLNRAAVLLVDLHGLTISEVGEALGLTVVAVQSRLQRARRTARKALEEGGWHV